MIVRGIGLAALVLIWPCSAVGQTSFWAGEGGALVCDSPKPLDDYKTIYKDAKASGRFLTTKWLASCQLVRKSKNRAYYQAFRSPQTLRQRAMLLICGGVSSVVWTTDREDASMLASRPWPYPAPSGHTTGAVANHSHKCRQQPPFMRRLP